MPKKYNQPTNHPKSLKSFCGQQKARNIWKSKINNLKKHRSLYGPIHFKISTFSSFGPTKKLKFYIYIYVCVCVCVCVFVCKDRVAYNLNFGLESVYIIKYFQNDFEIF